MRRFLFASAALLICTLTFAQSDSAFIRQLADEILLRGKAYEQLRHLTKKIGPRLAGSPGMVKAEQWGAAEMKGAGADQTILQECKVPHWVRGGKDEAVVTGKGVPARKLDVIALGNSIGSPKGGVQAQVIEVSSFDELDKRAAEVKGKIVFYNYRFKPAFVRTFQAYSDAVAYRGQGPSRAARHGAIGVIIRSMSHSTDNIPHTGSTRYDSAYAKIPAIAVGLQDADWLSQTLQSGKTLNMRITTHGYFLPDTTGHNVIGELKGSLYPEEIITIGGHLDSWDNCEGAHDDGAGCVQTLEVLRAFKALNYRPQRTIRFVLFANEENGLRGGSKYAEEAVAKKEKHIFALESDAGGFTPRGFGFTANDEQYKKLMQWLPLVAPYGCSEWVRGGGGADIGPLNRSLGTPMASLNPDSQRYFDFHHARNDVFEAVNKRELDLGAVNMAALIYLVDRYGL